MSIELVPLIMRWMHVFAAIVALGGSIYIRFVLMPTAQTVLDEKSHTELRTALTRRWMKFVHTCILLFLVSGFYNYIVIQAPHHKGQAAYHALFGVKFLLALAVFAIAVALTSLKPWSQKLRANARSWMAVLIVLAVAVVCISGVMRALPAATAAQNGPGVTSPMK